MEITDPAKAQDAPSGNRGRRAGRRAKAVALATLGIWIVFAFVDAPSEPEEAPAYVPPGMSCGTANLCAKEAPDKSAEDDHKQDRPARADITPGADPRP